MVLPDEGMLLVAVRRAKTDPNSETANVRYVTGNVSRGLRALSACRGWVEPTNTAPRRATQ